MNSTSIFLEEDERAVRRPTGRAQRPAQGAQRPHNPVGFQRMSLSAQMPINPHPELPKGHPPQGAGKTGIPSFRTVSVQHSLEAMTSGSLLGWKAKARLGFRLRPQRPNETPAVLRNFLKSEAHGPYIGASYNTDGSIPQVKTLAAKAGRALFNFMRRLFFR